MRRGVCGVIVLGFVLVGPLSGQEPLTLVKTIPLPRVEGRIDHLAFDPATERLFVAALGNNTVEVLDVKTSAHLRSLPGFREPQGIAVAGESRTVAVANGQGEGLQLLNGDDFRIGAVVRLGDDADNVRYDAAARALFVGYGSGAIAAVSVTNAKAVGEARLPGHPESFQLERGGRRIFVNVPSAGQIAVIDRTTMTVTASWPVTSAKANYPMALDEANHRVFIGCRGPAMVLVYDTAAGKEIASFAAVGDTDDLFYDAARKRVYVVGGGGFVDAFQAPDGNRFTRIAHVPTAAGARTGLYVAEQNTLFVAVPRRGAQAAEVRVFDAR